jgi:hypothetical protein
MPRAALADFAAPLPAVAEKNALLCDSNRARGGSALARVGQKSVCLCAVVARVPRISDSMAAHVLNPECSIYAVLRRPRVLAAFCVL